MDKRKGKRVMVDLVSSPSDSLDDLFEQFYHAKISEGRTANTLGSYRNNYKFFNYYLNVHGITSNLEALNQNSIRNYIVWMLQDKVRFDGHKFKSEQEKTVGLSPTTVNIRIKFLRAFIRFLREEKLIEHNPLQNIKKVEENDEGITILSKNQLKGLLSAPDQKKYSGLRDYVLMNLLLDAFLRINEALSLRIEDVDLISNQISVRAETSKSRRTRTLPITKRTAGLMKDLIQVSKSFESEYVFLANYGERLTAGQFRHRLKMYAKTCRLGADVHPHLFRHTAATMFLEAGGDLRHLQMILGHRDLRMVIRYTHLSSSSLKNQHEQYNPLNTIISKLSKNRVTRLNQKNQ